MNEQPVEVPVGLRADQWVTVLPHRRILLIAHNVTTVTRLLDILPAFDSDPRIQIVVSWSGSDPFHRGLAELLDELGLVTIGWDQARHTRFDLAIAASHHGGLSDITAPIVILSHGIGYTKYSPGNRKQETGNRKQANFRTFAAMAALRRSAHRRRPRLFPRGTGRPTTCQHPSRRACRRSRRRPVL